MELLVPLVLLGLLRPPAGAQPCPSEMNGAKDLLEVNCTGRGLSAVPAALPGDTGILLLASNRLAAVATAAFLPLPALRDLDLARNGLRALRTGAPLPSLKELVLSHNALEALPAFTGLAGLTHLALAHNRVATVAPGAFEATARLQYLDLRGNLLRSLPAEAFGGLEALKELDLSDNVLEKLPRELLQDLRSLETLWLSGNLLQSLPPGFFPEGHFFPYVFLTENPWRCDCELLYLRAWIRRNDVSVYRPERGLDKTQVEVAPESVVCHGPAEQQRTPVMRFTADCGAVGDADEEEEEGYGYGEGPDAAAPEVPFLPPRSTASGDHRTPPSGGTTQPPSSPTRAPLGAAASSLAPSTRAATAAASPTAPAAAAILTLTSLRPATTTSSPTTSSSTPSPATPTSTRPPGPSSAVPAVPTRTPGSASTSGAASTAAPSTPKAFTTLRPSSSPRAVSTVSSTAATLPARPGAGSLRDPVPLCPCSPLAPVPVRRPLARAPRWLRGRRCLLRWGLYLLALALLLLSATALLGWLLWLRLVAWPSWNGASPAGRAARYSLGRTRREWAGGLVMVPPPRPVFCTIKEVELHPDAAASCTYCTIKDLELQRGAAARPSFCTTKELWIRRPPEAASTTFSRPPAPLE